MCLHDNGVSVGTVPGPVHLIRRDPLKVPSLAMKALFLDEEPDLSFLDVIDLFGLVNVRHCMITRRPRSDHQATLIAIALYRCHGTLSFGARSHAFTFWNIVVFYMKRHNVSPFALLRST